MSNTFFFKTVSPECFQKYIDQLQPNKAVGHDGIRATLLKLAGPHFTKNICDLFNTCVIFSCFPSQMKRADKTPFLKKDDTLCNENYRSANMLITVSAVFERILCDHLNTILKRCWVHFCQPTEKVIVVSMLFLGLLSTGNGLLITALSQWTSQRRLIWCHMVC